jgi:hypothetical protein
MPSKVQPDGRFLMWGRLTAEEKHMLYKHGFGSPPIGVPSRALRPSKPTVTEDPVQPNPSRDERKGEAS